MSCKLSVGQCTQRIPLGLVYIVWMAKLSIMLVEKVRESDQELRKIQLELKVASSQ